MPFHCAKALCATFCHEISGALIPIFGPDFPSRCTSPASPRFGDMIISQQLIAEAVARAPRHDERPEIEIRGNEAAFFNLLDREPATSRPASLPRIAPLRTASHLSAVTRRSFFDGKTTRERTRDTKDASHKIGHNSTTTSSGLETHDAAGELRPDGEDCEDCERPCVDAGPSLFNNSRSHKRLFNHHRTTDGEGKRRKLVDDAPLMTEGMYQHQERSTLGRRALPQGRGLAAPQRRESRDIAREKTALRWRVL